MSTIVMNIKSEFSCQTTSNSPETFSLTNLICGSQKPTTVSAWKDATVLLKSVVLEKRIYRPNFVRGLLEVKSAFRNLPELIEESLLDGTVELREEKMKEGENIVSGYLIHQVTPTLYTADDHIDIVFIAYSPDKLLSYDKSAQAFTAKRLCGDIIPAQFNGMLKGVCGPELFQQDTLHNTMCAPKGSGNASSEEKEIIIPYLMQYNESFYSFLRRVTYRSGEYMFFEDGKLHVGLNVPTADPIVADFKTKAAMGRHFSRLTANRITSHHHNINDEETDTLFAEDIAFNEEYSQEDYSTAIKSDPNKREWGKSGSSWVEVLKDTLTQDDLFEMSKTAVTDISSGFAMDAIDTSRKNDKHNKKFLFKQDKGKAADKYHTENNASDSSTAQEFYRPYMMYDSLNQLMANAYREIRIGEEKTLGGMQRLEMDMIGFVNYKLGQIVTLPGTVTKYVIVHISRRDSDNKDTKDHYTLDIVPLSCNASSKAIFPPMQQDIETVRTLGPQTAFITNTKDVSGLGRVQVRFHWQTSDGDATPLIRMSQGMASDDAGVFFTPNENDEVIVNFTNGNADMPYVSGFLFNMRNKAPEDTRTIRSSHGHHITFDDSGDDLAFAKSLIPIWKPGEAWYKLFKPDTEKLKKTLDELKKDCSSALDKLKEKGGNDYDNYNNKCERLKYRKEFLKKAQGMNIEDPVLTDNTIHNKRYEMQNEKSALGDITWYSMPKGENRMYDLREEIKERDKKIKDSPTPLDDKFLDETKKVKEFYSKAMAITDDDVRKTLSLSEDKKQDKRYDVTKAAEEKTKQAMLPKDNDLENKKSGDKNTNKLDQLQAIIDDDDNASCEGFVKPDESKDAIQEYKDFVDAFNKVVAAKKAVDDSKDKDDDTSKYHTGGITMADDSGLYKLDLNASKRAITIDSPMGTVTINAMTGITISAPNGDVKISGKNVSIEAGNNLSISAGNNIKKNKACKKKLKKENALETAAGTVADVGEAFTPDFISDKYLKPVIDMKAVRCFMECFARPIEGSLKLHTENNLMLEAGGETTSADMSSMQHAYNQRQVSGDRTKKTAAAVRCLNDTFDEIKTLRDTAKSNFTTSNTKLNEYVDTNAPAGDKAKAIAMLKAKFGADGSQVCSKIINDVTAAHKTVYKLEDIYDAASNSNNSLASVKAKAEEKFEAKVNILSKDNFVLIMKAKDLLEELNKALALVNALAASISSTPFAEKSKSLANYSTWFLDKDKEDMLGLKKNTFTEISTFVGGMKVKNDGKVYDKDDNEVNDDILKLKKRKLFKAMMSAMLNSNKTTFNTYITGTGQDAMAFFRTDDNGNIPVIEEEDMKKDDKWTEYVEKLEKYEADDSTLATVLNQFVSCLEDKVGGGVISKTASGFKGIIDEVTSRAVESQGHIYLTAKDSSTAKLDGTSLQPSTSLKTKFEDIKEALKG